MGSASDQLRELRALAEELEAIVVSVDYRLAPEHPYPTPLEDCYAALTWAAALPDSKGLPLVVAGVSAGGGLAAGLALAARDRGGPALSGQVLIYPMLDDRTAVRGDARHAVRRLWDNKANRFGWTSYLGTAPGLPDVPVCAAPSRASDLSSLPPTWIGVGTLDLFHDESVEYARRLSAAGVDCQLEVVQGAFHGFDVSSPRTAVAARFRQSYVSAIDRVLLPKGVAHPEGFRPQG